MAAARWLRRLIAEALAKHNRSGGSWILKCRIEDRLPLFTPWFVSCDASPWGGGVVLWLGSTPIEYTHFPWSAHTLTTLKAKVSHTSQTFV